MARTHPIAVIIVKFACKIGPGMSAGIRPWLRLFHELELDAVPSLLVDDRRMQAVVDLALVAKSSNINRVREDPVDVATRHKVATRRSARADHSNRHSNVLAIENDLQSNNAANFKVAPEDFANEFGVLLYASDVPCWWWC
jgi:hypothetical protein